MPPRLIPALTVCAVASLSALSALTAPTPAIAANEAGAGATPAPPACTAAQLHLHPHLGPSGSAHYSYLLTVTNTSHTSCTVSGYPAVTVLAANGHHRAQATPTLDGYLGGDPGQDSAPQHLPPVTLSPRATATAMLEGLAFSPSANNSNCPASPGLLVREPHTHTIRHLHYPTYICADITIHPLLRGTTGTIPPQP